MIKKICMAVVVSLFSFSLQASELKKVSVQLLWKHQFEFAGFYMAKEKGFYKDAGINVDLKEYQFGTNIAQEVSNGKVDFGVDSSSLILDKINGLDVYLLMPFLQTSPFVLMSKQRDDLKTVLDLKNKKIMITPNQVTMASLNAMFKINQLSNKDFISQEHSFNVQDLIDGKTDAMSVYLSNEPYYMIEKGLKYTIFNPSDYGFNFYDNVLFTSKKLATNNPDMVKDFNEATQKGWEYAYTHIEETANVILKSYNTQNKTFEHLVYEGNQLKKMSHFGEPEYQKFKPEVINQIIQTYNLLDISKSTIDINELVYPDAIYKESDINFALLIKIFIAVLILLIGFYYWNRKLSKLNKKIQQSQEKVSLLLNNAGQGFLTFKKNFKIDSEYSKECEKLLGENIASKDISQLLFSDEQKEEFFKSTLQNALHETMEIKRNSYLTLLPSIILLNKKAIKLEYKILEDETFMMILTNITTQKKLENKIKKEQEIFKMVVAVASESAVFL
jgi:ABC-type nitrate/sulfonate/bicarbonate transport system substrate-binding protein